MLRQRPRGGAELRELRTYACIDQVMLWLSPISGYDNGRGVPQDYKEAARLYCWLLIRVMLRHSSISVCATTARGVRTTTRRLRSCTSWLPIRVIPITVQSRFVLLLRPRCAAG